MQFINNMAAYILAFFAFLSSDKSFKEIVQLKLEEIFNAFKQYKIDMSNRLTNVDSAITQNLTDAKAYVNSEIAKINSAMKKGFTSVNFMNILLNSSKQIDKFEEGIHIFNMDATDATGKADLTHSADFDFVDKDGTVLLTATSIAHSDTIYVEISYDKVSDVRVYTLLGVDRAGEDELNARVEEQSVKYDELKAGLEAQKIITDGVTAKITALNL